MGGLISKPIPFEAVLENDTVIMYVFLAASVSKVDPKARFLISVIGPVGSGKSTVNILRVPETFGFTHAL